MITFFEYSQRFINRNSPSGDLAMDIRFDTNFPKKSKTRKEIKDYLMSCNACDRALEAFETMWKSYKAFIRRGEFSE